MDTVQAAIEVRAIGQRTRSGDVTLRDVSLAIGHDELVAIIGSSGSGKTALLDAMSGLRPPATGTVLRWPPADASRETSLRRGRRVGYVPSADTIHPALPLARAFRYIAALRAAEGGDAAIAEALHAVGLARKADMPAGGLDPGERKRAAIAGELLAPPGQLFLAEPTAFLDSAQGAEVMRLLRRLTEAGITVVLTTHSPFDAARCDKVAVLAAGGHLAFFGTPQAACGYFGANSLYEVYEGLAGLGDPAATWSRRFLRLRGTSPGGPRPAPVSPQPGSAWLVPDSAGPHSAGRPVPVPVPVPAPVVVPPAVATRAAASRDTATGNAATAATAAGAATGNAATAATAAGAAATGAVEAGVVEAAHPAANDARAGRSTPRVHPARQVATLIARDAEVVSRSRRAQAVLLGAPVAVLLAFCVLLAAGALDGSVAVALAWAVLGGLAVGFGYGRSGLPPAAGALRSERYAGLSIAACAFAKAAIGLPALAAADAIILAVPAGSGRLRDGYVPAYLTVLCMLVIGLAAALARRAVPAPGR